jgi:hypothetical protein
MLILQNIQFVLKEVGCLNIKNGRYLLMYHSLTLSLAGGAPRLTYNFLTCEFLLKGTVS